MKTIKSTDLKIGDKVYDIPPGNLERILLEVVGFDVDEIHMKPISEPNRYIFDNGKDYYSFPISDDWYLD